MSPEQSEKIFEILDQGIIDKKINMVHNILDIYMEEQGQVEIKEIKLLIPNDLIEYDLLKEFKEDTESMMIFWNWLKLEKDIYDAKDERVILRVGKNFEIGFNYVVETPILKIRQERLAREYDR